MADLDLSGMFEKDRLHHAYVVEAQRDEGLVALRALIESFGVKTRGNPDFYEHVEDVFHLKHAQKVRTEQSFRGAEGARKIFLIAFNTIGHEAQNALLKTLEEPTEGTHFFFVTRTRSQLLPTFLSRVQVVSRQSAAGSHRSGGESAGEKFLAASVAERMETVTPMTKAKDDDKPQAKEDARFFLESLERALYEKLSKGVLSNTEYAPALVDVVAAKRHLSGRSPSLKLLLEHLALTLPSSKEE
ncbi:MAG: hypothetical protein A3C93_06465 [Candidatus Lloydbacteria bacterium RIFCSPHIGHO2_02_FULL_54_17]|uniref:DNA polymerase III subunit gamma/tau n=1 Tax=Candidatus Lloydbacteria bacterium RIFCSPHIGHO2_02_FULL_54_17 TaxID=1798664 RepID=A0A1G2DGH8_9BACT|nr:MAG: hypothetical protein A2762_01450 [Candidatus Lloydbacteria bacterium RIFCSPHIGHO2_01_FULL_54_11]OGZ12719.1 MAG: hypothetical protein A3C93_06465 [Candidatus Lloydbacteria bacterium RIFCSPHIGHO2_02_FULL_54_17]OGZ13570.1 MAG: hypothetical protein A2948_05125 [Candidatus Lloydbacteria bacterium RIFCSPLOWO2_01_FULL_54_18]